jgi:hypothetical protein
VVAAAVGYTGAISFDTSRPDGTPRKLLDVGRLAKLGWRASTSLEDGIRLAYQAYLSERDCGRVSGLSAQVLPTCRGQNAAGDYARTSALRDQRLHLTQRELVLLDSSSVS